jgi:16S rRNA (cytosine1402-N4)-methyltransferase
MKTDHQNKHIPVLLSEVLEYLKPQKGETYLDVTAGYGGHAQEVLGRTLQDQGTVLVDRDPAAIQALQEHFAHNNAIDIQQSDFYRAAHDLEAQGKKFDMILADLGVSSPHLDNASRGFSLKDDGPLDMRMDTTQPLSAADIVNTYSEDELIRILKEYGEEPKARSIARNIIESRPIQTTSELAAIVTRSWPGYSKVHPATRTFQALRIAVNDELGLLTQTLPVLINLLNPGGRLAIISFHSLEDRLVKQFLAEHSGNRYDVELELLTKHPITASEHELVLNPRARSAKLRAAVKIKKKG